MVENNEKNKKRRAGAPTKKKSERKSVFALVSLNQEEEIRANAQMKIDNDDKKAAHVRRYYLRGMRHTFQELYDKYKSN